MSKQATLDKIREVGVLAVLRGPSPELTLKMVDALTKGDEVVTSGGLAGKITDMGENFVMVEIAEGMAVKVRRGAIESVLPKGSLKEL